MSKGRRYNNLEVLHGIMLNVIVKPEIKW